jgi:hypothetical protein
MKKTFSFVILLFHFVTIACPDLSGEYYCQTSNNDVTHLKLINEVQRGIISFQYIENHSKEGRWIVDGKLRSLDSSPMDGVSNAKYSAACSDNTLKISMSGELMDFETRIRFEVLMSLDSSKNLIQETSGYLSDGTPLPTVEALCYRSAIAQRKN